MSQRGIKVFLAILIPLGAWALHGFASSNGLIQMFEDLGKQSTLSDGVTVCKSGFTGIDGLDNLLKTLLNFFWPVVNGEDVRISLYSFMFAGQGVALMAINVLEGMRYGNKSLIIGFVTIYGLLYMVVGLAVMAPAYLLLHLVTSPTASKPTKENTSVREHSATAIIFGIVSGYVVPTILMTLPHPEIISTDSKMAAVVLWQAVPLWTTVCVFFWSSLEALLSSKPSTQSSPISQAYGLRKAYAFALVVTAITHIATVSISIASYLSPQIFHPTVGSLIKPVNLLVPTSPFDRKVRIENFLQGATWFLQFDYITVSVAYLSWAVAIRYWPAVAPKGLTRVKIHRICVDTAVRVAVLGPLGTALSYVWERDEIVADGNDGEQRQLVKN